MEVKDCLLMSGLAQSKTVRYQVHSMRMDAIQVSNPAAFMNLPKNWVFQTRRFWDHNLKVCYCVVFTREMKGDRFFFHAVKFNVAPMAVEAGVQRLASFTDVLEATFPALKRVHNIGRLACGSCL